MGDVLLKAAGLGALDDAAARDRRRPWGQFCRPAKPCYRVLSSVGQVGTGTATSVRELHELLADLCGVESMCTTSTHPFE